MPAKPAKPELCLLRHHQRRARGVVVLETERLIAFPRSRPLFRGHTLLVPKLHVRLLSDLPADQVPEFFTTAQRLERGVEDGLGVDGSMILINNVVSQTVPHLHLHVIPRTKGDGLRFWLGPRHPYDGTHPAEAYAEKIRAALRDVASGNCRRRGDAGDALCQAHLTVSHVTCSLRSEPLRPACRSSFLLSERAVARLHGQPLPRVDGVIADAVIADIAAGTAGVTLAHARRHLSASVVGVDLTPEMLREGSRRAAAAGVASRVGLVAGAVSSCRSLMPASTR